MLLAVDVGNTQTVIGIYDESVLHYRWRVATNKEHTSDELRVKVLPLFSSEQVKVSQINGAILASVVPKLSLAWHSALSCLIHHEPLVCNAQVAGDLFPCDYANPAEIGADRIADAVAARNRYGSPVIVVDFGTATNIEVIDKEGRFVGGVIAPGVDTSAAALFSKATKLASIDLIDPHTSIGHSTEEAIQAGIVYGEAERVDGLVRRILKQLGYPATVVATGGLASRVAQLSSTITYTNSDLTLEGLRLIYQAWQKGSV